MKTIQTKHIPATNHKPARIKAWHEGGSLTISREAVADEVDPHIYAIAKLAQRMEWLDEFVVGGTKDGMVAVFLKDTHLTVGETESTYTDPYLPTTGPRTF